MLGAGVAIEADQRTFGGPLDIGRQCVGDADQVVVPQRQRANSQQRRLVQPGWPLIEAHAIQAKVLKVHAREAECGKRGEPVAAQVEVTQLFAAGKAIEVQWVQRQVLVDQPQFTEAWEAADDQRQAVGQFRRASERVMLAFDLQRRQVGEVLKQIAQLCFVLCPVQGG